MRVKLHISVVVFHPDLHLLEQTLQTLWRAADHAQAVGALTNCVLTLVDNSVTSDSVRLSSLLAKCWPEFAELISNTENTGYGRGHNRVLAHKADYYLVINPDVQVDEHALAAAVACMQTYPQVGMVTPLCFGPDGQQEYLCKAYPTVFTLFLRGFAPKYFSRFFQQYLARYELRDRMQTAPHTDVMIASGCFMFLRHAAVKDIQGFNPAFFLYFEDFDLSLRLRQHWQILFAPSVKIVHFGGHSAKKGWRHILMFVSSAWQFFNFHGWRWY